MVYFTVISGLIVLAVIIHTFFKLKFTYWKHRNVPTIKPRIPFGNLTNPFYRRQSFQFDMIDCYKKLKANGHKYGGFYLASTPCFLPLTKDLVKHIMSTDFSYFVNRGFYFNEKDDPISAHLFAIEDDKWRNLRAKLTPTFTSGKMKMMFQTLLDCSNPFIEKIRELNEKGEAVDIKELVACFTTDVIGSCAFGIQCNSFKHPDAEFRRYGILTLAPSFFRVAKRMLSIVSPNFARRIGIVVTPRNINEFFIKIVKQTVNLRETTCTERNDFMQLLIELKNRNNTLTINEVAAQAFVFFVAGFETSSTAMTFCLYELSKNIEIQDKVREEINTVSKKQLTYDDLAKMKYLEQVIKETLRKYPAVPVFQRVCSKTYQVPGSNLILEKGTNIIIPIYGMHHDSEYFDEPEKFDPERFSEANKSKIAPFTYQPFGGGPRNCIGLRFGMMQMKVGLISILKNFKIRPGKNTPENLSFNPNAMFLTNLETIYLDTTILCNKAST